MVSDNFSASGPKGHVIGVVTPFIGEGNVSRYVPMQSGRRLENKPIPSLLAIMFRTSLARLAMRKPSDIRKRNTILKELR